MHGFVRDRVEDLLAAKPSAGACEVAKGHLNGCLECAAEFNEFRAQSELLRSLRPPEEIEPSPGFYARVLQRIEERAKKSIWWVFVYSPVGKRLAYVSLATAVVLGSYVIAQETRDGGFSASPRVVVSEVASHYDVPVVGNPDQQRQAVLENFASHSGTLQ
jgi:anti-sigma factor RsiW